MKKIQKKCRICGKLILTIASLASSKKFCSLKCKYDSQKDTKHSLEHKNKISETAKRNFKLGLNNLGWAKDKKRDKKFCELRSIGHKKSYAEGKYVMWHKNKNKDNCEGLKKMSETIKQQFKDGRKVWVLSRRGFTSLEKLLYENLSKFSIKYESQKQIFIPEAIHTYPDAFIEPNICIYVDGDYWHRDRKVLDKWQTKTLTKLGFVVFRFGEKEFKENPKICIKRISKAIPRKDWRNPESVETIRKTL